MVSRGLTSADDALDGPVGFLAAAAGAADADRIVDQLANRVFENPGVWIKPHPNGALTHPGAGCLLALLQDNDIRPADIERIGVRTNERVWKTLQHHDPQDSMQAKFSMEFTLAVIAVHRRAGLSEFTNEMLRRPDIVKNDAPGVYTAYETADAGFTNVTTFVDIRLSDGRTVSGRADHARGSTTDPMDFDYVASKFRECAEFGGADDSRIDRIVGLVSEFDMLEDVKPLATALYLVNRSCAGFRPRRCVGVSSVRRCFFSSGWVIPPAAQISFVLAIRMGFYTSKQENLAALGWTFAPISIMFVAQQPKG